MKVRIILPVLLGVFLAMVSVSPAFSQTKRKGKTRMETTGKPHHNVVGHHYQPTDEPAAARIKRRHRRTHSTSHSNTRHSSSHSGHRRHSKHYYPRKEQ